jgi:hypothetical protein
MTDNETQLFPTARARRYLSYLVRLWQEIPGAPWRASAQDVATDERHGFANLESLFVFLREQTERTTQADKGETHDHLRAQKP